MSVKVFQLSINEAIDHRRTSCSCKLLFLKTVKFGVFFTPKRSGRIQLSVLTDITALSVLPGKTTLRC